METTLLTRLPRPAQRWPEHGECAEMPRVQGVTAPLRFWTGSRRIFWGSLLASMLLHGSVLAALYWLAPRAGWLSPQALAVAQGKASIALTASVAAVDSAAKNDAMQSLAILRGNLSRARVEQPLGSPQPRIKPAGRLRTFDPSTISRQVALPETPFDETVALLEIQPAITVGGRQRGNETIEQAPDATTPVTPTPRAATAEAEIDSTASLPSSESAASTGADGDRSVSVVYNPAPRYPPAALAARQTGRVVVRVTVSTSGTVVKASVLRTSGIASLDTAALEAVRQWRFRPAMQDGIAVEKEIAVPIRFTLAGDS